MIAFGSQTPHVVYVVMQWGDKIDSVWFDKPAAEERAEELAKYSYRVQLREVPVGEPQADVKIVQYP